MKSDKKRLCAAGAILCAALLAGCGAASSLPQPTASSGSQTSSGDSTFPGPDSGTESGSGSGSGGSDSATEGGSMAVNETDIPSSLTIEQEGMKDEVPAVTHPSPLGFVITYANEAYALDETDTGLTLAGNPQASTTQPESYLTVTRLDTTRENALESIRSEHRIEEEAEGVFGRQSYPAVCLYGTEGTAGASDALSVEYYVTEHNGAVYVTALYYSPDRAEADGAWLRAMLSTLQFDAES